MLAKDIVREPNVSWAIANPSYNYNASAIKNRQIDRVRAIKVKLVSTDYYDMSGVWNWQDFPDSFRKAPSSQKGGKGFLVVAEESSRYLVVSAKQFIDTYPAMEAHWAHTEKAASDEQARRLRMNEVREAALSTANANAEVVRENALKTLSSVLKTTDLSTTVNVRATGEWAKKEDGTQDETVYNTTLNGMVELTIRDFQRLVEQLYEAREALL